MSATVVQFKQSRKQRNATSSAKGRQGNEVYRVREHLTEAEIEKLLTALRQNRYGHRDWLIGLMIYRHGLRVSEACDLRWHDIDLTKRTIIVRRLKGSTDSSHYLERDEHKKALCGAPTRRACFDHEYSSLHRNVAGAFQGHLALNLRNLRSSQRGYAFGLRLSSAIGRSGFADSGYVLFTGE
jgi:integrase